MKLGAWIIGTVAAAAFVFGAVGTQASPLRPFSTERPDTAAPVQFYFYGNEDVLGYKAPPRPRYSDEGRRDGWGEGRRENWRRDDVRRRDGWQGRDDGRSYGHGRRDEDGRTGRDYRNEDGIGREQERPRREWSEDQERRRLEAEREALQAERRRAKEEYKDKVRAWNRAHGY